MTRPTSPPRRRKVLIVDDHPIVRQGLRSMIDAEPDLRICGEAENEREARLAIRELQPDVVVVDLSLDQGDGISLVRDVHAHHPDVALLVLSMHDESIYAERLLAVGASGYIMKQAAADQLTTALRCVLDGGTYLSEGMRRTLVGQSATTAGEPSKLSARELQVLGMIGRGVSSRDIAQALSLSVKTIESHRLSIKRKLNLTTNAQLVQYAIKWYGSPAA
ncbi:MAG: response regulator transcription factor [Steroidobacteraceae bacterium]